MTYACAMAGKPKAPAPQPKAPQAQKKKEEKSKCTTCCAAERKTEEVDLTTPKGTSWDGQNKALIDYSEKRMQADPCVDTVFGTVREDGGYNVTSGGWSRADMGRDVWNSGALGPGPVPSYTLTPKTIELQTLKGL